MPGIATGETFSFAEGKLYLYASASGTTSGSGVGFMQGATITCVYGWDETITCDGRYENVITGRMITLQANALHSDQYLFRLANLTGAVNARFEALVTGGRSQSAWFLLYSGVIHNASISESDGAINRGSFSMYARAWTAIGG